MPKRHKIPSEVIALCGDKWSGNKTTLHGVETLIATYEANGGVSTEVYIKADPSFCYTMRQLNTKGKCIHAMISSSAKLTLQLAHATSVGKDWHEIYGQSH